MRLYRYLTELFQEKRDWKIRMETDDTFIAFFVVNEKKWRFTASDLTNKFDWEMVFEDEVGNMNITNLEKENVIEIFSYVISITKYFLKKYRPSRAEFGGLEFKQHKLYKKMVSRYKKEIEKLGYEVEDRGEFEDITLKKRKK